MQGVLRMLEDNNTDCVTITGEAGIGKTEMALQVCHYMGERHHFSAIFFARCRDAVVHQGSIPTSGGLQAHIQRMCQLVSEAQFTRKLLSFESPFVSEYARYRRLCRGLTTACM